MKTWLIFHFWWRIVLLQKNYITLKHKLLANFIAENQHFSWLNTPFLFHFLHNSSFMVSQIHANHADQKSFSFSSFNLQRDTTNSVFRKVKISNLCMWIVRPKSFQKILSAKFSKSLKRQKELNYSMSFIDTFFLISGKCYERIRYALPNIMTKFSKF